MTTPRDSEKLPPPQALSSPTEQASESAPESSATSTNQLISVICHDLRSPLSSIVMGAGFLQRSLAALEGLPAEKRIIESILRSSDKLNLLIRDLHDVAHIETGRFEIDKHKQDAASLVQTALGVHGKLGSKRGIKVEADTVPVTLVLDCDRDRLVQALGKLIDNGARYAPVDGTVRVTVEVLADRVSFVVRDEGAGMSDERRAHAFDHYWHAAQSPRDGTGLGLTLVRGIARAHGGDAEVESATGKGTRASFWLPLAT